MISSGFVLGGPLYTEHRQITLDMVVCSWQNILLYKIDRGETVDQVCSILPALVLLPLNCSSLFGLLPAP